MENGNNLEAQVKCFMQQWDMLKRGDKVLVGVSGGADSVCLLWMLAKWQAEFGYELQVLHVNHQLRGADADADEQYTKTLCRELSIPFIRKSYEVESLARDLHMSTEEAGRVVRRQAFLEEGERIHATKIALAHHGDDNAETLLLNLCRGTGLAGLGGIQPVNGMWIRPLLTLRRTQIEEYLSGEGVDFCQDETNETDDYTRNRIRHHVLPYLEEQINEQSTAHIMEVMDELRQVEMYLEEETREGYEACIGSREKPWGKQTCSEKSWGEVNISKEAFFQQSELIQSRILKKALGEVAGAQKDLGRVHVTALMELLEKQTGRRISLPYQVQAVRTYEGICLKKVQSKVQMETQTSNQTENQVSDRLETQANNQIDELAGQFHMEIRKKSEFQGEPWLQEKVYTKYLDYDIINDTIEIRLRKSGDYITIDGSGKKQSLKSYFINQKISQELRDHIPLVCCGSHVLWVAGYRISSISKIKEHTEQVLKIQWKKGEKDGREY